MMSSSGTRRGEIDDAEFFAGLRSSLGIGISDAQFLEGWNAIFAGEMPGIAPLLARAAKRVPLYAFSNTNRAHVEHFSQRPMPTCSAISAKSSCPRRSGFGNRTRQAYDHVVKAIGVPASRIVFFDDLRRKYRRAPARAD